MSFASKIECARATLEMYSGFGVPVRVLQMDIDGAFAKFEQKQLGEIQWNTNHCLTFRFSSYKTVEGENREVVGDK